MPKQPIIFPHIPKCGGTSILRGLQQSNKVCFFDYDHPPSHMKYFSDLCLQRNDEFHRLDFSPFEIIYGHFPIDRYKSSPEQIVIVLRHPVERAVSQYFYFRDLLPVTNTLAIARVPEILDVKAGTLDLPNFVRKVKIDSFYRSYVGLRDTRTFRLVGFTDRMKRFSDDLKEAAGIDLGELGNDRSNEEKPPVDDILPELETILRAEVDWYLAQREHWLRPES